MRSDPSADVSTSSARSRCHRAQVDARRPWNGRLVGAVHRARPRSSRHAAVRVRSLSPRVAHHFAPAPARSPAGPLCARIHSAAVRAPTEAIRLPAPLRHVGSPRAARRQREPGRLHCEARCGSGPAPAPLPGPAAGAAQGGHREPARVQAVADLHRRGLGRGDRPAHPRLLHARPRRHPSHVTDVRNVRWMHHFPPTATRTAPHACARAVDICAG